MITARKETVKVPVTTWKEETQVTLTMSLEMAQLLYDITQKISGSPTKSRRGLVSKVRDALTSVEGINRTYYNKYGNPIYGPADISTGMNFTDTK